jgi:sugar phosphate isomerase/epimerase
VTSGDIPLTLASYCLVGVSFEERVASAAAAGFEAIGLSVGEYNSAQDTGLTDADMRAILAQYGLSVAEFEAVVGIAVRGPARPTAAGCPAPTSEEELHHMFRAGEALGAGRLQILGTFGTDALEPDVVERFAALCDRAAGHGLALAIEFLPGTNIPDVAVAAAIARDAGRRNGGLCVDSWHYFRGNPDDQALRRLPPELITVVQLDDGPLAAAEPDYLDDTRNNRVLPGEGEFDLVAFLRSLSRDSVVAPISVEILSADLRALGAAEAAASIYQATVATLARAGVSPTSSTMKG